MASSSAKPYRKPGGRRRPDPGIPLGVAPDPVRRCRDVALALGSTWEQGDVPGKMADAGDALALLGISDEQRVGQQVGREARGGGVALHRGVLSRDLMERKREVSAGAVRRPNGGLPW